MLPRNSKLGEGRLPYASHDKSTDGIIYNRNHFDNGSAEGRNVYPPNSMSGAANKGVAVRSVLSEGSAGVQFGSDDAYRSVQEHRFNAVNGLNDKVAQESAQSCVPTRTSVSSSCHQKPLAAVSVAVIVLLLLFCYRGQLPVRMLGNSSNRRLAGDRGSHGCNVYSGDDGDSGDPQHGQQNEAGARIKREQHAPFAPPVNRGACCRETAGSSAAGTSMRGHCTREQMDGVGDGTTARTDPRFGPRKRKRKTKHMSAQSSNARLHQSTGSNKSSARTFVHASYTCEARGYVRRRSTVVPLERLLREMRSMQAIVALYKLAFSRVMLMFQLFGHPLPKRYKSFNAVRDVTDWFSMVEQYMQQSLSRLGSLIELYRYQEEECKVGSVTDGFVFHSTANHSRRSKQYGWPACSRRLLDLKRFKQIRLKFWAHQGYVKKALFLAAKLGIRPSPRARRYMESPRFSSDMHLLVESFAFRQRNRHVLRELHIAIEHSRNASSTAAAAAAGENSSISFPLSYRNILQRLQQQQQEVGELMGSLETALASTSVSDTLLSHRFLESYMRTEFAVHQINLFLQRQGAAPAPTGSFAAGVRAAAEAPPTGIHHRSTAVLQSSESPSSTNNSSSNTGSSGPAPGLDILGRYDQASNVDQYTLLTFSIRLCAMNLVLAALDAREFLDIWSDEEALLVAAPAAAGAARDTADVRAAAATARHDPVAENIRNRVTEMLDVALNEATSLGRHARSFLYDGTSTEHTDPGNAAPRREDGVVSSALSGRQRATLLSALSNLRIAFGAVQKYLRRLGLH